MTRIRGSIIKVDEVSKLGYSQPSSTTGKLSELTFNQNIAGLTTATLDLPATLTKKILHSVIVGSLSTAIQEIYIYEFPDPADLTIFNLRGDFYFSYDYPPRQYFLGDIEIPSTSLVRVFLVNNSALQREFDGSVIWGELP